MDSAHITGGHSEPLGAKAPELRSRNEMAVQQHELRSGRGDLREGCGPAAGRVSEGKDLCASRHDFGERLAAGLPFRRASVYAVCARTSTSHETRSARLVFCGRGVGNDAVGPGEVGHRFSGTTDSYGEIVGRAYRGGEAE